MPDPDRLARISVSDLVQDAVIFRNKLRITLTDGAYFDFWWSRWTQGRFAYHWERTHIDGTIHRHDNIPHLQWWTVGPFPKHFHSGSQQTVTDSDISENPE